MGAKKLSSLQLELLKIYSFEPDEEDLLEIKKILADYFSNKLIKNVNQAIIDDNITEETFEKWLNEN